MKSLETWYDLRHLLKEIFYSFSRHINLNDFRITKQFSSIKQLVLQYIALL